MNQLMENVEGITMYSDAMSMACVNGSNGTSLPIVVPRVIEEPKMGLVPQQPIILATKLFND